MTNDDVIAVMARALEGDPAVTRYPRTCALRAAQALQAVGLRVVPAGEVDDWWPIETAPKDMTVVLTWAPELGVNVSYYGSNLWFSEGRSLSRHPTHWRPLPVPPRNEVTLAENGVTKPASLPRSSDLPSEEEIAHQVRAVITTGMFQFADAGREIVFADRVVRRNEVIEDVTRAVLALLRARTGDRMLRADPAGARLTGNEGGFT